MSTLPLLLMLTLAVPALAQSMLPGWTLERVIELEGESHHVQGLVVLEDALLVSSVDAARHTGYLTRYDRASGRLLKRVEAGSGAAYHPGGMDCDVDSLWVPVAEYKAHSRSRIERRSKTTLELLSFFEVADHIGCLTVVEGRLLGGNWDARQFYEWTADGRQLRMRDNPNPAHYQDVKSRDGQLVAGGLKPDVVEWLDGVTLRSRESIGVGKTDRGAPLTREGMDFRDGRLYLLPEDSSSRLFVFRRAAP